MALLTSRVFHQGSLAKVHIYYVHSLCGVDNSIYTKIRYLSMYCPRYHSTGKGWGFDLYESAIKCPHNFGLYTCTFALHVHVIL